MKFLLDLYFLLDLNAFSVHCWAQSGKECKASIAGVLEVLVTHSFSIHVGLRYNMLVFCLIGLFKCVIG
jgi:hypothetical protein